MKVVQLLRSLKPYYVKEKFKIILLAVTLVISNLIVLLYSALWGFILQNLTEGKFFEAVLFILLHLILFVADTGLNAFVNYLQNRLESTVLKDIQKQLYAKVIDMPAVAFEEHGVGEITNRIHNDTDMIISIFMRFVDLISRFIAAIIIVFIFIKINMIIALEVIIFALITFFITKYFTPRMKKANKELKEQNDELFKETNQVVSGIREVKSLGIKKQVLAKTGLKFDNVFNLSYQRNTFNNTHYLVEWVSYAICEFIILFTVAFLFYKNMVDLAVIVLVYSYLGRINWAVTSYTEFMGDYQKLVVSFERLDAILNDRMYKSEVFGDKVLSKIQGDIKFENVDFMYPNDEKATLHNINIDIKPHVKTAIVGSSGSGKTSIFNLLLRYFDPTKGRILIDDVEISELSEDTLRSNIGVIRQDTFLFNMSIMDNFRMVKEDVTLKEVRKVCKAAYIDSYIMELPNGYDTIIGEHGINLSGGQKQRLSIARTLLKDSKIILFDEATSALDNKSQEYIKKTIDELVKDHTVVIIAHRLSTIIDADEIIFLDKGKVIAVGNHKKLLKNAKYKELYNPDIIA